jgi:hypothetical protein
MRRQTLAEEKKRQKAEKRKKQAAAAVEAGNTESLATPAPDVGGARAQSPTVPVVSDSHSTPSDSAGFFNMNLIFLIYFICNYTTFVVSLSTCSFVD